MSDNPKLKYQLPSEKSARTFARYVFEQLEEDTDNINTRQEKISGFSDFLIAVATIIAKSKANE